MTQTVLSHRVFAEWVGSLIPHGEDGAIAVVYRAAVDESGTHEGAPVLAVACLVTTSTQWKHFEREWSPYARKYENGYHATKASDDDNAILAELIGRHVEIGMAVRIAYADAKAHIPSAIMSRYGAAYPACVRVCIETVSLWCDTRRLKWVAWVLEDGHKTAGAVKDHFKYLKDQSGEERRHVLSDIWVGKENLITHSADLIAHEWAKCYGGEKSSVLTQLGSRLLCGDFDAATIQAAAQNGLRVIEQTKRAKNRAKRLRKMTNGASALPSSASSEVPTSGPQ